MLTSKISSKGQVTLPKQVRESLGATTGDLVTYELDGDRVILARLAPFDQAFHSALSTTLSEWDSAEDNEAFGDL